MIKETLEMSFSNFFENYSFIKQGSNFFSETEPSKLSLIKLILSNGITMPHEMVDNIFNRTKYEDKYCRRIERFNKVVRDGLIHKVFVRADDKITEMEKLMLYSALDEYGALNYSIFFVNYSEHLNKIQSNFDWKRTYIDWKKLLENT